MFHRLAVPSYIGGLPVGYDYLNAAPPLLGSAAPIDPVKASGPNAGTYFVAFGEDGRAAAVNRAVAAIAANTDEIDNFLHASIAVTTSVDINPLAAAVIVGTATVPVFCGPPGTPNTQAGLEQYFHITDLSDNDLVDASTNTQVKVTAVSAGIGTFYAGSVTLTLSPAPTVPFRIWYGTRSSLAEMTKGEFVRPAVASAQKKQAGFIQFTNDLVSSVAGPTKGGSLVGISDTAFNNATTPGGGLKGLGIVTVQQAVQKINDRFFAGASKVDIDTAAFVDTAALTQIRGGGIGAAFTPVTVQQAMQVVDKQLVRRRAYTAVLTDGTNTVGGDYDGTNIDAALTAFANGASYFVRSGAYYIADAAGSSYADPLHIIAEASAAALILDAARTTDFTVTTATLDGPMSLVSLSAAGARYKASPVTGSGGLIGRQLGIMSGALYASGATAGGCFALEDSYVIGTGVGAGTTNGALEVSGQLRTSLRRVLVSGVNGTTPRALYLHDITDPQYASATVEDSTFQISDSNVNALYLKDISVPMIFRNCLIEISATSGTGYAALLDSCSYVLFDNCIFKSANGQVVKALSSTVHFRNCLWYSTDATPGAATGQMVVLQPTTSGTSSVLNCRAIIGASSVRGSSGTLTKAIIELGGLDGTAASTGGMQVDGLEIKFGTVSLGHNYSTVVLHGCPSDLYKRTYRGIGLDTGSIDTSSAGTTGGVYTGGFPAWLEVGGGTRSGCLVDHVSITSVKSPAVSHARYVSYVQLATVNAFSIEGSASVGAGSYSQPICTLDKVSATNLRFEATYPIKCTTYHVRLVGTSWRGGLFYGNTSTYPSVSWISVVSHSEIRDVMLLWSSAVGASTAYGVNMTEFCGLIDCKLWIDGIWGTDIVNAQPSEEGCRIQGNTMYWERQAVASMLNADGGGTVVTSNQFIQAGASLFTPTWSVTGTDSVDQNNTSRSRSPAITGPISP